MATLYLHIGTNKTGSSALRAFFKANRELLKQRGYCFPLPNDRREETVNYHNGRFLRIPAQGSDGTFERPEDEVVWRRHIKAIVRLFRKYPNVILSDEDIWNAATSHCPGLWKNLKREADAHHFDVRIIAYLRRQDQYLQSLWAERVKERRAYSVLNYTRMTFAEALEDPKGLLELDYYAQLERIAAEFGRERVIVRVYERERFERGNVIVDFMSAIGLPRGEDYAIPEKDQNPSVSGNTLEIKRIINFLPKSDLAFTSVVHAAMLQCNEWEQERYSMFPPQELAAFVQNYEECNRLVARDYFGSMDEPLFQSPGVSGQIWNPNNPHMYESIIRFFGAMILEQQREIDRLKWRNRWRTGLRKLKETRLWRRLRYLKRAYLWKYN